MPLWKFYHPVGSYTPEDKKTLAERITGLYSPYMPKFYVGVVFQEVGKDSFYIGGEPTEKFVRICIDHIARAFPSTEVAMRFINEMNAAIEPFVKDRGFDWELHIDETPFEFWSIQGYFPPRQGTEDEKRWMAENRPSPRTHD